MSRAFFCLLLLSVMSCRVLAQQLPSQKIFWDESVLAATPSTDLVNDPSANKGTCWFRAAEADYNTMWFGPYQALEAGHYLVSFRLKVASNSSSEGLIKIDVVSQAGGVIYNSLVVRPNMFRASNQWQVFTLPIVLPHGVSIEARGIGFQRHITGVYMDYIEVTTGSASGTFSDVFTVDGLGKVGLGMATPGEKLEVNGNIRAKEVKVETSGWPDYVFEQGYQLPSLQSLERYIKKYQHLPEIPAAKEVESSGVALGEMNKSLLKKVEELTLHLIEQNKRLVDQELKLKQQQELILAIQKDPAVRKKK